MSFLLHPLPHDLWNSSEYSNILFIDRRQPWMKWKACFTLMKKTLWFLKKKKCLKAFLFNYPFSGCADQKANLMVKTVASVRWLKSALFTSKGTLHTQTFVCETMYLFLRIFVWIFCRKYRSRIHYFETFCISNIFREISDLWNY